jgi:hypothetical protein
MNIPDYLSLGSAVLALGWLAYHMLLRNTGQFRLNRVFLLAVLGLGLLNPLLAALPAFPLSASTAGALSGAFRLPEAGVLADPTGAGQTTDR